MKARPNWIKRDSVLFNGRNYYWINPKIGYQVQWNPTHGKWSIYRSNSPTWIHPIHFDSEYIAMRVAESFTPRPVKLA